MSTTIFRLDNPFQSARRITQSVFQVGFCLNLYHAEIARILGFQCQDIGQLSSAQLMLQSGTPAYSHAILFILMYQALYDKFSGNVIAMSRWLHCQHPQLETSPHLLMVDQAQISQVVDLLSQPD
jgi:hypothetical protein